MRLNRAHGDEYLRRDLLVRQAARGQFGNLLFAGSKPAAGRSTAPADPVQLRGRRVCPARTTEPLERRSSLLERATRSGSLLGAALHTPEVQQRAGALEPQPQRAIVRGRARELRRRGIVVALGQPEGSPRAFQGRQPPGMLLLAGEAIEPLDHLV